MTDAVNLDPGAQPRDNDGAAPSHRLAATYAEALMEVAERRNQVDEVAGQLAGLEADVFKAGSEFDQLLGSPLVPRSQREQIVRSAFEGKVSDLVYDFVRLLGQHDRLELLRPTFAAYRNLIEGRSGRIRVRVRSAAGLDEGQTNALRETLAKKLGKEPVLDITVDPDLLGGLVIQVGDEVLDTSVRARLVSIQTQLLARAGHEVSQRRDHVDSRERA